jgi:transcriptional repressor NrdR
MICPFCKSQESKVVDKRDNNETGVTRRRRECLYCQKRFTTYERLENMNLYVLKRSGRQEEFDRDKLKKSILRAVKKRPITDKQIEELLDDIEIKLLNRKATKIKTTEVGKMVLTRLKKIDHLGYLLFSAVYKEFESLEDLEKAIKQIKTETGDQTSS